MMDLFLERMGSLADDELRAPRSQEVWFVLRFVDTKADFDRRPEAEIDQDTGRPDKYNREAELAAMADESVKDSDTTEVTDSGEVSSRR